MPLPSLLSLLPAASISPRGRRAKHRAPAASHHLHSRLPFSRMRAPPPLCSSHPSAIGGDELHLLEKPSPCPCDEAKAEPAPALSTDEALAPFLKFFRVKSTDPDEDTDVARGFVEEYSEERAGAGTARAVASERGIVYYDPRPGDLVVGVVVGGDERTLEVDVGAGGEPALMLTKEAVPISGEEFGYLTCDCESNGVGEFAAEGRVGVVVSGGVEEGEVAGGWNGKEKGAPVVAVGAVMFAEVLGRTLGGRPLLSTRRLFRRVAWHRVRQLKQLNVPIMVKIFEWNAGGLLSRIEGLRAFLPKPEMMTRPRNFTDLKNNVGRQIHVCITRVDESTNELIISEKEAWAMKYLREGILLEGTVHRLFPYGAQIRIGETNRGGLLHISNITHGQLTSVGDVLKVGERVKALVIKSTSPGRIALSIKDLESEPGLFLTNKEKVFSEAEEMARRKRDQISEAPRPDELDTLCNDTVPFEDEARSYANWKWLNFIKSDKVNCSSSSIESGL